MFDSVESEITVADGSIIEEYKLAKSAVQGLMAQLTAVVVGLIGFSVAILRFGNDLAPAGNDLAIWYTVLLLLNFLLAYFIYQNVQLVALTKHIATLEGRLGEPDVFRWESKVARIWYDLGTLRGASLNFLVVLPAILLLILVYWGLGLSAQWSEGFLWPALLNLVYLVFLTASAISVLRKVDTL